MASPDHAATVRAASSHIARGCRAETSHDPTSYLDQIDAALDSLVAALALAEHERDAARSRLRDAPRGGAGSHWDGCHLSHIDCANAKRERAERQRDQAIEALREITETRAGAVTADLMLEIARDVLAAIEKDTA